MYPHRSVAEPPRPCYPRNGDRYGAAGEGERGGTEAPAASDGDATPPVSKDARKDDETVTSGNVALCR